MVSTSSSTLDADLIKKWDAFISFRGTDIRRGFLSHLFKALQQKKINTFMDENLGKGEDISPALLEIIQQSYVSVVVFSENYANSSWCLDELVKIRQCKQTSRQIVLPVFYNVDPTDVQKLSGNFGKAFDKLKEEHKDCSVKVDAWCQALTEISNLSGWDSRNIESDSTLVEKITSDVLEKLSLVPFSKSCDDELIGINWRINKVESLLCIELENEQRVAGIWGMGGIGKTTLAREVFSRIKYKFEAHYFAENVKEEIRKGSIVFRDKIICELLGEKLTDTGRRLLYPHIWRRLESKKVLIVFDDVDDPIHLKDLARDCGFFRKGSRIIVTSRDRQVLKHFCSTEYIYEVEKLNEREALQLFSLHAFSKNHPIKGYLELSMDMITYCQGIPLALTVLGCNLCQQGIEEWKSELEKLKNIPNKTIQNVLRKSYDSLERHEKNIFLDIACFFRGQRKDNIERILEDRNFCPKRGITRLIDKSLITISNNMLDMHDLLQKMGKEIVHEECEQLGGRSRLWNSEEIYDALTTNTVTDKVQGILLDLHKIENMELSSEIFKKTPYMRFLKIYYYSRDYGKSEYEKIFLPDGLECLPNQLRYLHWAYYPLKSLPQKFSLRNLAELRMPNSKLEQLWDGDINKDLANLKVMDLKNSKRLIRISNLSTTQSLEILSLDLFENLVEIPSSDGLKCLPNELRYLYWVCCPLKSLPQKFNPRNLVALHMRHSKLEQLWDGDINKALGNLKVMDLRDSKRLIRIPDLSTVLSIERLSLYGCENLVEIPSSLQCLERLEDLDLGCCLSLKQCPELPCSLKKLCLYRTAIEQMPSSIGHCSKLVDLDLRRCEKLASLPQSIDNKSLKFLNISYCNNGLPENIGDLECQRELEAYESGIKTLLSSINQLRKLEHLYCSGLTKMPSLTGLSSLQTLRLADSDILEIRVGSLMSLRDLDVRNCKRLRDILELPSGLMRLDASNYTSLESVSGSLLSNGSFKFFNCLKLKGKIVEDVLARHLDKKDVRLYIPGSEVPQQIKHKNKSGSSLSFRLNPHHFIIGFTFCAVFDPRVLNSIKDKAFFIGCTATCIDESGNRNKVDYCKHGFFGSQIYSKHIFLWYTDFDSEERFIEASFQFYIRTNVFPERHYEGITECGVHPIYRDGQEEEQENEDQSSLDLNLSQSYSDDCVGKDKKRSRNQEQDHQHDEKLKRPKSL